MANSVSTVDIPRDENALRALGEKYLRDGWIQFDLADRGIVKEIRAGLLTQLRLLRPEITDLEGYHRIVLDDEENIAIQKRIYDWFIDAKYGPRIIAQNLDVFRALAGPDLHVQAKSYLRIARPGKPQDNVGIHRDTHYGGSPYEMSVHIPFTETGIEGSLGVISGSHTKADAAYPYEQGQSQTVERGSVKHQLGFTYAPKVMSPAVVSMVRPTGTRLGQAMAFCLSAVHGQMVNNADVTRFSADVRVAHSLAPINWERIQASGYYKPLSQSPLVEAARAYYHADATFKAQDG